MKKQDFTTGFTTQKTAEQVFNSINHVSGWWNENIEGRTDKLDDVFTLQFSDTFVTIKITESNPGKKIVWYVTDCYLHWLKDKTEWKDTQIVFDILSQVDGTFLRFTHDGLAPEVECYNDCVKGWNQYINGSLFSLVTESKGKPERKKMHPAAAI